MGAHVLASTMGVVMLGAGLIGYLRLPTLPWERTLLLAGACLLIFPTRFAVLAGLIAFVAVFLAQRNRASAARAVTPG